MDIKKILGANIRKYRKRYDLTQEQLAESLNLTQKFLSSIEVGRNFVSAEALEKLCEVFNVSPSTLFYSSENSKIDDSALTKIDKIFEEETKQLNKRIQEESEKFNVKFKERIRDDLF